MTVVPPPFRGAPRFFVDPDCVQQDGDNYRIIIAGDEARHAVQVLRLGHGDELIALDGLGHEYPAHVMTVEKTAAGPEIVALSAGKKHNMAEPPFALTLIQALPKADKMDEIVQKGTETGMTELIPVVSERVIPRYEGQRLKRRLERWRRIAKEAAKQSGRGRIPRITSPLNVLEAVKRQRDADAVVILFWEQSTEPLKRVLRQINRPKGSEGELQDEPGLWHRPITLVIGPEGGFSESEATAMTELGCLSASLGPRLLRTETAGPVAAAMILYDLSDGGDSCRDFDL